MLEGARGTLVEFWAQRQVQPAAGRGVQRTRARRQRQRSAAAKWRLVAVLLSLRRQPRHGLRYLLLEQAAHERVLEGAPHGQLRLLLSRHKVWSAPTLSSQCCTNATIYGLSIEPSTVLRRHSENWGTRMLPGALRTHERKTLEAGTMTLIVPIPALCQHVVG